MRQFEFQLRIPDGRIVTTQVTSTGWQWAAAFAEACARVEADLGIAPDSGVICLAYRSVPDPFSAVA